MASWYDSDEEPMPAITTMDEIRAANEKSANEPLSDTYLPQVGNDYDSESSDSDANWQQMKYNNEDSAQKKLVDQVIQSLAQLKNEIVQMDNKEGVPQRWKEHVVKIQTMASQIQHCMIATEKKDKEPASSPIERKKDWESGLEELETRMEKKMETMQLKLEDRMETRFQEQQEALKVLLKKGQQDKEHEKSASLRMASSTAYIKNKPQYSSHEEQQVNILHSTMEDLQKRITTQYVELQHHEKNQNQRSNNIFHSTDELHTTLLQDVERRVQSRAPASYNSKPMQPVDMDTPLEYKLQDTVSNHDGRTKRLQDLERNLNRLIDKTQKQ